MEFFTQNREVSLAHAESSLELTHRSELENLYSSSIHGTHDAEVRHLRPDSNPDTVESISTDCEHKCVE